MSWSYLIHYMNGESTYGMKAVVPSPQSLLKIKNLVDVPLGSSHHTRDIHGKSLLNMYEIELFSLHALCTT